MTADEKLRLIHDITLGLSLIKMDTKEIGEEEMTKLKTVKLVLQRLEKTVKEMK